MGNKSRAGLLSIALLSVLGLHASEASAWQCGINHNNAGPRNGAVDVPLNTLLWCSTPHKNDSLAPVGLLKDGSFQSLALSQRILKTPRYEVHMLKPELELLANTKYAVTCGGDERHFTTGSTRLTEAPAIPSLENMLVVAEKCGAGLFSSDCSVSFPHAVAKGTVVVLSRPDQLPLQTQDKFETIVKVQSFSAITGDLSYGRNICDKSWPEAQLGARAVVSLGAFDIAGNFSGWSRALEVTLPDTNPVLARAGGSASQARTGSSKRVFVPSTPAITPAAEHTAVAGGNTSVATSRPESSNTAKPSTNRTLNCSASSASEHFRYSSYLLGFGVLLAARRRRRKLSSAGTGQ